MSADNGLILNLKSFKVTYYSGEGVIDAYKCKSLEEAITKVQELERDYFGTEYGCQFRGKLKPKDDCQTCSYKEDIVYCNKKLQSLTIKNKVK